jgi:RNA polymerase sigma-70 factor (ECF subfamily)
MSNPTPTDAELVRRTVAGDRDAFARLYDRYARLVRAVAGDAGPGRAEDISHDVFLRAYRAIAALRATDRFAPWLVGIARRVVQEARRRPPGNRYRATSPADNRPRGTRSIRRTKWPTCSGWWAGCPRKHGGPSSSSS